MTQHRPTEYLELGLGALAHRGGENVSTMLDWAEPKGKAALVLVMPA